MRRIGNGNGNNGHSNDGGGFLSSLRRKKPNGVNKSNGDTPSSVSAVSSMWRRRCSKVMAENKKEGENRPRARLGRPPLFDSPEELWNACCEYFDFIEANPFIEQRKKQTRCKGTKERGRVDYVESSEETSPKMNAMTLTGLQLFLDVSVQAWAAYRSERGDDFAAVVTQVEQIIWDQKFKGASAGLLNASIISQQLGLKTYSEHIVTPGTGSDKKPFMFQIMPPSNPSITKEPGEGDVGGEV